MREKLEQFGACAKINRLFMKMSVRSLNSLKAYLSDSGKHCSEYYPQNFGENQPE